jgi:hypothetical protein
MRNAPIINTCVIGEAGEMNDNNNFTVCAGMPTFRRL